MDITTIHRSGFLSGQIRITLNDLECPIQLKVRFTEGTFDVRLLRVSDSTIRIGVARGGRGSGLEGLTPPCGQLTRCFSAVAELLVPTAISFGAPAPLEFRAEVNHKETGVIGLSYSEDAMIVVGVILTQCQRVTDGQTDRHTDGRIYYS